MSFEIALGGLSLDLTDNKSTLFQTMVDAIREQDIAPAYFNTLRPRQNGCQFPDDILKCIFLNENL